MHIHTVPNNVSWWFNVLIILLLLYMLSHYKAMK